MREERRDESRRGRHECLRHVSPRSLRLTERPYLNAYGGPGGPPHRVAGHRDSKELRGITLFHALAYLA